MIDALYTKPLLRLAADAFGAGRLADPDLWAEEISTVCGDKILVTVKLAGPRIATIGHDTKACVLCQASASLLAALAPGLDASALEGGRQAIAKMLSAGPHPAAHFQRFAIFSPVSDHPARHGCVLLPFKVLLKAMVTRTI